MVEIEAGILVGVGVGVAVDPPKPKKLVFFEVVDVVFVWLVESLFFKLIFPVKTRKKTMTTTRPKTNEITLLKLSI